MKSLSPLLHGSLFSCFHWFSLLTLDIFSSQWYVSVYLFFQLKALFLFFKKTSNIISTKEQKGILCMGLTKKRCCFLEDEEPSRAGGYFYSNEQTSHTKPQTGGLGLRAGLLLFYYTEGIL